MRRFRATTLSYTGRRSTRMRYQVVREQRFRFGHGRCVFRVRLDQPRPQADEFVLEP
jgi:hypothetical protein